MFAKQRTIVWDNKRLKIPTKASEAEVESILRNNDFIIYTAACLIDNLTLPLSKPITLTFTASPSLTTSVTLATLLSASSEM